MNSFTFSYPTKVYFGEGSAAQAFRTELRKKGKTVLLAYGGGSVKKNGVYDEVKALLKQADKTIIDLSLIHISEPTRLGMISYAVFCLKKKKKIKKQKKTNKK